MVSPTVEKKVAALLEVLDADARHLESALSRLDQLRSSLIRRENSALERLLGDIQQQADAYRAIEQKRQQRRRDLALDLGCTEGELTLSRLRKELTAATCSEAQRRLAAAVADRQARLRSLAAQVGREHSLTALLLREAARFNQSLLRVFLGSAGRGCATYAPTGTAHRDAGAALMSMQF
ncbi:MAG: flagellar protein FlgN [Planctomycetes bacterium]|nr:flagellar protein FlgN [Planctomycetota bacterium]